jgi:hypothetical protein
MKKESRNFRVYANLAWLNGLPAEEAEAAFYGCSHSEEWSRLMTAARQSGRG